MQPRVTGLGIVLLSTCPLELDEYMIDRPATRLGWSAAFCLASAAQAAQAAPHLHAISAFVWLVTESARAHSYILSKPVQMRKRKQLNFGC